MIRTYRYRTPKTSPRLDPIKGQVIGFYEAGNSLVETALEFGVSETSVLFFLNRHGVARRPRTEKIVALSRTDEGRSQRSARRKGQPPANKGKKYKLKHRKYSPAIKGANNPSWKGGVTPEHRLIRTSPEYKAWRKAVFERDNYTCQECQARSCAGNKVTLNADHILPFSTHPELRLEVSNGRTLCKPCHQKTPTYGVNRKYAQASTCGVSQCVA